MLGYDPAELTREVRISGVHPHGPGFREFDDAWASSQRVSAPIWMSALGQTTAQPSPSIRVASAKRSGCCDSKTATMINGRVGMGGTLFHVRRKGDHPSAARISLSPC